MLSWSEPFDGLARISPGFPTLTLIWTLCIPGHWSSWGIYEDVKQKMLRNWRNTERVGQNDWSSVPNVPSGMRQNVLKLRPLIRIWIKQEMTMKKKNIIFDLWNVPMGRVVVVILNNCHYHQYHHHYQCHHRH